MLLIGMISILVLALAAAVSASTGEDGPSPPEIGDPVGTNVSPHGGYSSSTNFCMQCHDVHDADGAYALMATGSVNATCSTCHSIYGGATSQPAGGPDPGGGTPVNAIGTVSARTAYDDPAAAASHDLGQAGIPGGGLVTQSDWDYSLWKYTPGEPSSDATTPAGEGTNAGAPGPYGLYCATCHTPHGEYGKVVNNWTAADEGTAISYNWGAPTGWADAYLDLDTSWYLCPTAGDVTAGAGHGAACIEATIADAEDQVVSLFGYKLLTAYPNHTYSAEQSYNTEQYNHDGAGWCTACHTANDLDGPNHNHETGCSACHGNPAGDPASADFPHTSTSDEFLIDYPDALCIGCHTPGSLP